MTRKRGKSIWRRLMWRLIAAGFVVVFILLLVARFYLPGHASRALEEYLRDSHGLQVSTIPLRVEGVATLRSEGFVVDDGRWELTLEDVVLAPGLSVLWTGRLQYFEAGSVVMRAVEDPEVAPDVEAPPAVRRELEEVVSAVLHKLPLGRLTLPDFRIETKDGGMIEGRMEGRREGDFHWYVMLDVEQIERFSEVRVQARMQPGKANAEVRANVPPLEGLRLAAEGEESGSGDWPVSFEVAAELHGDAWQAVGEGELPALRWQQGEERWLESAAVPFHLALEGLGTELEAIEYGGELEIVDGRYLIDGSYGALRLASDDEGGKVAEVRVRGSWSSAGWDADASGHIASLAVGEVPTLVSGLKWHTEIGPEAVKGNIEGRVNGAEMVMELGAGFEEDAGRWVGTVVLAPLVLEESDLPATVLPGLPPMSVGGEIAGNATFWLDLKAADWDAIVDLQWREGRLAYEDGSIQADGVEAGIGFVSLRPPVSRRGQRIAVDGLQYGDLPIRDVRFEGALLEGAGFAVERLEGSMFDGNFTVAPFEHSPEQRMTATRLSFEGVDANRLATFFPAFKGEITGRLDGGLPIAIVRGRVLPGEGYLRLAEDEKSTLRYPAEGLFTKGMEPGTKSFEDYRMVEEALEDLDVMVLRAVLFPVDEQDKSIVLRLEGLSQRPIREMMVPVNLNLNMPRLEGDLIDFVRLIAQHRDKLRFE